MRRSHRIFTAMLLAAIACTFAPADASRAIKTQDHDELARLLYEARLRKLHLVRPDLIAYPVAIEVVC